MGTKTGSSGVCGKLCALIVAFHIRFDITVIDGMIFSTSQHASHTFHAIAIHVYIVEANARSGYNVCLILSKTKLSRGLPRNEFPWAQKETVDAT